MRIRVHTMVSLAISNIIAIAILITTAATLSAKASPTFSRQPGHG
jgi:hypothetical protein